MARRNASVMARNTKKQIKVIAGALKGRVLIYPPETALRPTMQRTREAIFGSLRSLGSLLEDAVFVDLYAAAGGIGIEALSRGARFVHFVENDGDALACLRANLERCGVGPDRCLVHPRDVMEFLGKCELFENDAAIVYADPPYESGQTRLLLEFFGGIDYAYAPLLIVEHRQNEVPEEDPPGLSRTKLKRFGQSWVSFFVPAGGERP